MSKYLKYAIGEIILVVIGILIALQINNWNEVQKHNLKVESIITNLKKDLDENIHEANRVIDWHTERDSIMLRFIRVQLTADDYANFGIYHGLTQNWNIPLRRSTHLKALLEMEDLGPQYSSLKENLNLYEYLIDEESQWYEILKNTGIEFIKRHSEIGFKLEGPGSQENLDEYYATNTTYYNEVVVFRSTMIGNFNRRLMARRNAEVGLLYRIHAIQQNDDIYSAENWLSKYGLYPFESADCEQNEFKITEDATSRKSFLVINDSDTDKTLVQLNENGQGVEILKIPANDFITSYLIGLNNQFIGTGFELRDDNQCVSKYRAVRNGYLILN